MANILYLVHRLPYPPNKGDKVRSYNLLKHLASKHRVFLGTFIDDPEDEKYIEKLHSLCADLHVAKLNPRTAKIRSLNGLLADDPLTLRYYRDAHLQDWVNQTCTNHRIDTAIIFCSAMAQYVENMARLPTLVDFVDVDSAKWTQYSSNHRWPMSWLYKREGKLLLAYERKIAGLAARSFFVTDAEAALFTSLAPECNIRVEAMCNGVDSDYFSPAENRTTPYPSDATPIVFTGAMDYWPNIDAVSWFASEVLPKLIASRPGIRFYIVGRSPSLEVAALAGEHVVVTGTVADVRPYIQHAAVIVAPLRVARGIQNKILEAMAMERPVIASEECAGAVEANLGQELLSAHSPDEFVSAISDLLDNKAKSDAIGLAARQRVVACYSWAAHMSHIDRYISPSDKAN